MPTETVVARIAEWLQSLWTDPAAAAEFAESPATSLATHDLGQSDLDGVDLRSVAGGLGGSGGLSPEGRNVLMQFSSSPSSAAVQHVTPVHQVAYVTREVHHNNPEVTKVFNDNRVFVDNSTTIDNHGGFIGGDINLDNDVTIASGKGAVAAGEGANVNAATGDGSVANVGGEVNQANGPGSQVVSHSDIGQQGVNSDGSVLGQSSDVDGHGDGNRDDRHDDTDGKHGEHDGKPEVDNSHGDSGEPTLDFGGGDSGSHGDRPADHEDPSERHGDDAKPRDEHGDGHDSGQGDDLTAATQDTHPDPDQSQDDGEHQPFHSAEHSPFHPSSAGSDGQTSADDPLHDHALGV